MMNPYAIILIEMISEYWELKKKIKIRWLQMDHC